MTEITRMIRRREMLIYLWADAARSVVRRIGSFTGGVRTRAGAIDWMRENARLCDVRPLTVAALRARCLNRWEVAFWSVFDQRAAA